MPSLKSAQDVLATELKEIYSAEKQLARALPRMGKKISNERLKECIDMRVEQGGRLMGEIEEALDAMETSRGRPKNTAAGTMPAGCRAPNSATTMPANP